MKLPSILSVACVIVVFLLVGTFNSAGFVDMNNRDRTNCGVDAGGGIAAVSGAGVGQLSFQRSTRFAGEFGAYLLLTFKDTGVPYDKLVDFVVDCISGRAWFASDFREPIPFPLNKLDRELRAALTRNSLPWQADILVYIQPPRNLLMAEQAFVPGALDAKIWSQLDQREQFVMQDYWKRYDNVPGDPSLSPEVQMTVVSKVLDLIRGYDDGITWPRLVALRTRLAATEGVELLTPGLSHSLHEVEARVTPLALRRLMVDPDVGFLALVAHGGPSLAISMPTIEANYLWGLGYTGSGVRVGILDSGVASHPNLAVIAAMYFGDDHDNNDDCNHGTHIAGVIRSNHATYRGAAYESALYSAKLSNSPPACDWTDAAMQNAALWLRDTMGVDIISQSQNVYTEGDGQSADTLFADYFVENRGVFYTVSAGNQGQGCVHVCIPADAYNIVSVGMSDDKGTVTDADDVIDFDSGRQTMDGRCKPDAIAPGVDITSTNRQGGFDARTGTSEAAPHAAGLAAQLRQLAPTADYLELKARMLNGDHLLRDHPCDVNWGWSYVDGYYSRWSTYVASGSVTHKGTWTAQVYLPAFYTRAFTVVWNREMTSQTQVKGVSDLDLSLTCPGGASDTSAGGIDNVERVQLTVAPGQTCTLTVFGYNVPASIGTQTFRIAGYTT